MAKIVVVRGAGGRGSDATRKSSICQPHQACLSNRLGSRTTVNKPLLRGYDELRRRLLYGSLAEAFCFRTLSGFEFLHKFLHDHGIKGLKREQGWPTQQNRHPLTPSAQAYEPGFCPKLWPWEVSCSSWTYNGATFWLDGRPASPGISAGVVSISCFCSCSISCACSCSISCASSCSISCASSARMNPL